VIEHQTAEESRPRFEQKKHSVSHRKAEAGIFVETRCDFDDIGLRAPEVGGFDMNLAMMGIDIEVDDVRNDGPAGGVVRETFLYGGDGFRVGEEIPDFWLAQDSNVHGV
jgi:hypothetical protein